MLTDEKTPTDRTELVAAIKRLVPECRQFPMLADAVLDAIAGIGLAVVPAEAGEAAAFRGMIDVLDNCTNDDFAEVGITSFPGDPHGAAIAAYRNMVMCGRVDGFEHDDVVWVEGRRRAAYIFPETDPGEPDSGEPDPETKTP